MVTTDQLIEFGKATLETGVELLRKYKEVSQTFHLITRENDVEVYLLSGDVTNSDPGKTALAGTIRMRIAKGDVVGVVMLSDTFFSSGLNKEQEAIRRTMGWNVEESAAHGLCEKKEAVMVTVESPILQWAMRREYRRAADGTVTEVLEPEEVVWKGGRMVNWFNQNRTDRTAQ